MEDQLIHSERQELIIGFTEAQTSKRSFPHWHMRTSTSAHKQNPVCEMLSDSLGFPWQHVPLFLSVAVQSRLTWGEADSKSWPSFSSLSEAETLEDDMERNAESWSAQRPVCIPPQWESDGAFVLLTFRWLNSGLEGVYNEKSNIHWTSEIKEPDAYRLWLSKVFTV